MMKKILTAIVVYLLLFPLLEFAEYRFNFKVWDQIQRTSNCYDWFEHYVEKGYDRNKDYSEGVFENNYTMTLEQATLNKYNLVYDKLGLEPGMKLLDAGCGTGVWMEFCQNRGVDVVGLTLSSAQAAKVREKGLEVYVWDYRKPYAPFLNQFDRITALGSSEHVCSSRGILKNGGKETEETCNKIRMDTWNLFYKYLKPTGKCYITLLTANENVAWSARDWFHAYILERHYGGYYSSMDALENGVIPGTGFQITDLEDKTKDYHWSSVADSNHFGHWTVKWSQTPLAKLVYFCRGLVTDPFTVHHWLYYFMDTWMWQFGGYQEVPLTDEQVRRAPVALKYFLLEKELVQSHSSHPRDLSPEELPRSFQCFPIISK